MYIRKCCLRYRVFTSRNKNFIESSKCSQLRYVTSVILRQTSTGQEQGVAETRKQKHLDMVFDRVEPNYPYDKFENLEVTPIITLGWWRKRKERIQNYMKNTLRGGRIYALDRTFDEKYLSNYAFNLLRQINTGIILGNFEFIQESVIQPLSEKMKFIKNTTPLVMTDTQVSAAVSKLSIEALNLQLRQISFSGRISKLVLNPSLYAANVVSVSRFDSRLRFGQLTFRILTEQSFVYKDDPLVVKYYSTSKVVHTGMRNKTHIALPRGWKSALSKSGRRYYYHTGTMQATWIRPHNFGVSPTHYDPASGTLGSGKVLRLKDDHTVVVENFVTLQKPLFNPKIPWRVSDF